MKLAYLFLFICVLRAQAAAPCLQSLNLQSSWISDDGTPYYLPYACALSKTNVMGMNGTDVSLGATANTGSNFAYSCAQIHSEQASGYGYYECAMKPSGVSGSVTTCQVVDYSPYREIHIKFIGNDTARVSLGYTLGGTQYQAGPISLKFDAKSTSNKYSFMWTSAYIFWYVNDVLVSSETGSRPLPAAPSSSAKFIASYLVEQAGISTYDTNIYTDPNVDRTYSAVGPTYSTFYNLSYTPVSSVACNASSSVDQGGSSWIGYDPNGCTLAPTTVIYADALASGWTDTDSSAHSLVSTDQTRGGNSISWDVKPNAMLYFKYSGTIEQADYYGLEFWVNGGASNDQQVLVQLITPGGGLSPAVNVADVIVPGITSYSWSRVVMPFNGFGLPADTPIYGWVFTTTALTFVGTIYVDDVRLTQKYPVCANQTLVVYGDALTKGWTDSSWACPSCYSLTSTGYSWSGNDAIRWEVYGNNGLFFKSASNVDPKVWQAISFYMAHGPNPTLATGGTSGLEFNGDAEMSVVLTGYNFGEYTPINVLKYTGGTLPPRQVDGTWTKITIPLYAFGIKSTDSITGIKIKTDTATYHNNVYLDDIQFIRGVAATTGGGGSGSSSSSSRVAVATFLVLIQMIMVYALL